MKLPLWVKKVVGSSLVILLFLGGVMAMLAWLMGAFTPKVQTLPGSGHGPFAPRTMTPDQTVAVVQEVMRPVVESAVGSVQPVHGAQVASSILAKVIQADVSAGQPVKKDQVLIRLEEADLRARLQQAQAAFRDAVSARERARSDLDQLRQLFERQAATKRELDHAQTALDRAQAMVDLAGQAIVEAETVLGYATIQAPMDGIVIDKKVNVGDTVTPGQVLLGLYDPTKMQVVASVREALAQQLQPGQEVRVHLEAMDRICSAQISEIVPESMGSSRSFQVKVTGPCPPGVHVGMFARLLLELGSDKTLVIPPQAVRRVGQLDLVEVVHPTDNTLERRSVLLGRTLEPGKTVEVLSGLKAGEKVVISSTGGAGHE